MAPPRTLSLALIGLALVLCAGAAEGVPARNQRHQRAGRSARLAADHPGDSSHDGEALALDASYGLHDAGFSGGDEELLPAADLGATADFDPHRRFTPLHPASDVPFPAHLAQTNVRGRAPPASIR